MSKHQQRKEVIKQKLRKPSFSNIRKSLLVKMIEQKIGIVLYAFYVPIMTRILFLPANNEMVKHFFSFIRHLV